MSTSSTAERRMTVKDKFWDRLYLIAIALTVFFVSCQPVQGMDMAPSVSFLDIEEALQLASEGQRKRLYNLASTGGNGAWYVLAEIASNSNFPHIARKLWKKSYQKDTAPFAMLSLSALLIKDPRAFWNPLATLQRAEKHFGTSDSLRKARIAVLHSLKRWKALANEIDGLTGNPWETPVLTAAAVHNKDKLQVIGMIERFILHCEDPSVLELLSPQNIADLVSLETLTLRLARTYYATGDHSTALFHYRRWLQMIADNQTVCEIENPPPVFAEMASAAIQLNLEEPWADLLYETAVSFTGAKRYAASYQSGKLYRSLKRYREAAVSFITAAEALPDSVDADRALWYRLKIIGEDSSVSTREEVEAFSWAATTWDNASRFTDMLEEFIYRRVSRGEWDILESHYQSWFSHWPEVSRAQAAIMLAFATHENRIRGQSPEEYLEDAYEAAPLTWWGIRAAGILNRGIIIEGEDSQQKRQDADRVAELLLRWDLTEKVATDILRNPKSYSDQTIRQVSEKLSKTKPRLSIRMITLLWHREGYSPSRNDLLLRFPLLYVATAKEAATKYGVPSELFFGLIKTESAWDSNAVSRSGAQGLTQFMPATWNEWEKRLKYPDDSNPMDPVTNLTFGAAYLSWLLEREWTNGWVDVLASYNAGGGRVRSWHHQKPGYGDDLFSMSIPIEEPRSYVSKVLSAATFYGYLYAHQSPRALHESWNLTMPQRKTR